MEEIDWSELKEESKSPKTYWNNLGWGTILNLFKTALTVGLVPCGLDLYKDVQVAVKYLTGDYYTYSVQNQTNLALMENCAWTGARIQPILPKWKTMLALVTKLPNENGKAVNCEPDCSWLDQEFEIHRENNQTTVVHDYSCFEKDPILGWITLALIFLPGVALFIRLICTREVRNCAWKVCIAILASLFFPLTQILTKFYQLFQFGQEWIRVDTLLDQCEGQFETFLQAGLQWYIIFSRPDRNASFSQWLAVVGSFLMIAIGQAKTAFANRTKAASMFEDFKKMALFTSVSFLMIYLFIVTAVAVAIIDKSLFFVSYSIMALPYLLFTCFKPSHLPKNDIPKIKLKLTMLSAVLLIVLIDCIIGIVLFNMDPDSWSKFGFFSKTQSRGNIWLGLISALNLISFICCLFFAFSKKFNDFLHTIV